MKLSDSKRMRAADDTAINQLKIPSTLLMTNAAGHIVRAALDFLAPGGCAAVFAGSGNNGGDGIAAAYMLAETGCTVRVFLTGSRERMTGDSREMERRLIERGGLLEDFDRNSEDITDYVNSCGVIIDAVFGIGLNSDIRGPAAEAVRLMNASPAPVVAADIPSGVEADTGRILGCAVKADVTVTFSMAKPGHFLQPGCTCCGRVAVCGIGIPEGVLRSAVLPGVSAVTGGDVSLPLRRRDAHKGDFGKVLIVAGSTGFTGAACFASRAAVRSGAGLVFLSVPKAVYPIVAVKCDEAMASPVQCDENGVITIEAYGSILPKMQSCGACLVGPGLGRSLSATGLVSQMIRDCRVPLILDADGINAVCGNIDILKSAPCPVILTPHDGEFQRLGGSFGSSGRLESAARFAAEYGCTLVLKGHSTVTAFPDGTAFINTTGNPGMAKGGSGDVLSGIIASLIAQGLPLKKAVPTAVFLHGKAGDACAEKLGEYSMTPSDMLEALPQVFSAAVTQR